MNPNHATVAVELHGSRYYLRRVAHVEQTLAGEIVGAKQPGTLVGAKYFTKRDAATGYAAARGWEVVRG